MLNIFRSLIIFLSTAFSVLAAPTIVVDENYNDLTLGQLLPNWVAFNPLGLTLPIVQDISVNSLPFGAQIQNDFSVVRPFSPIEGIVTVEIWMDPKLGIDTNNFIGPVFTGGPIQPSFFIGKNETDRWLYYDNNILVPFANVDGNGHDIKIVFNTSSLLFDLYFDETLIKSGAQYPINVTGFLINGIRLNSGRGDNGTISHFDDVKISFVPFDGDNDGIPDNEDDCSASNIDNTVYIEWCDSQVINVIFNDGCSLADLVDMVVTYCTENSPHHGKFASCFSRNSNELKSDGIISGQEQGALQSCAAQVNLP